MEYCIVSGKYETGTAEQQLAFSQLFGENNIQTKFDLYFHWYNIIHELGHSLVNFKAKQMNPVDEEIFVNCFAVQYWRKVDNQRDLQEVEKLNKRILSKMPSLILEGVDFHTFFNNIWRSEQMCSAMMYGYFQMLCVKQAFNSTSSLNELLEQIGYQEVDITLVSPYQAEINAKNAENVLRTCLANLKVMGCKVPIITLELVDNPEIQCCRSL